MVELAHTDDFAVTTLVHDEPLVFPEYVVKAKTTPFNTSMVAGKSVCLEPPADKLTMMAGVSTRATLSTDATLYALRIEIATLEQTKDYLLKQNQRLLDELATLKATLASIHSLSLAK